MTGRRGRRRIKLLDDLQDNERIMVIERGSTRSYSVENSLCKRLWTCRKTDYGMKQKNCIVKHTHTDRPGKSDMLGLLVIHNSYRNRQQRAEVNTSSLSWV
jgi:hypothetical protein